MCRWFEVPRKTVHYKPTKAVPKVNEAYVKPIKNMIEENPAVGYRTAAYLLNMNKYNVQRVFQLMRWHLSRSGRSATAESALEQALINRFR